MSYKGPDLSSILVGEDDDDGPTAMAAETLHNQLDNVIQGTYGIDNGESSEDDVDENARSDDGMNDPEVKALLRQLQIATARLNLNDQAKCHHELAKRFTELGYHEQAIRHNKKDLTICQQIREKENEGVAHRHIATGYMQLKAFRKALEHGQHYLRIAQSTKSIHEEQRAHVVLGDIYASKADHVKDNGGEECFKLAETHFKTSLQLAMTLPSDDNQRLPMIRDANLNLANTLTSRGEHGAALDYCKRSLEIVDKQQVAVSRLNVTSSEKNAEKASLLLSRGRVYSCMGLTCLEMKQYEKALEYLLKDVEICKQYRKSTGTSRYIGEGEAHCNVGKCLFQMRRYTEALNAYQKYKKIAYQFPDELFHQESADDNIQEVQTAINSVAELNQRKESLIKAESAQQTDKIIDELTHLGALAEALNLDAEAESLFTKLVTVVESEYERLFKGDLKTDSILPTPSYGVVDDKLQQQRTLLNGLADAYGSLGLALSQQGAKRKALDCHRREIALFKRLGKFNGQAQGHCNLGNVLDDLRIEQGKLNRSHESIQNRGNHITVVDVMSAYAEAERLAEMGGDLSLQITALENQEYMHRTEKEFLKAKRCQNKLLILRKRLDKKRKRPEKDTVSSEDDEDDVVEVPKPFDETTSRNGRSTSRSGNMDSLLANSIYSQESSDESSPPRTDNDFSTGRIHKNNKSKNKHRNDTIQSRSKSSPKRGGRILKRFTAESSSKHKNVRNVHWETGATHESDHASDHMDIDSVHPPGTHAEEYADDLPESTFESTRSHPAPPPAAAEPIVDLVIRPNSTIPGHVLCGQNLKTASAVNFANANLNAFQIITALRELRGNPNLHRLCLSGNEIVASGSFADESLHQFTNLFSMQTPTTQLSGESQESIPDLILDSNILPFANLSLLDISYTRISGDSICQVLSALTDLPSLTAISLVGMHFTTAATVLALCSFIESRQRTLEFINLSNTELSSTFILPLIQQLNRCIALKGLELGHLKLDKSHITHFIQGISQGGQLELLDLSRSESASELFHSGINIAMSSLCGNLKALKLSYCPWTANQFLDHMMNQTLNRLVELDLSHCQLRADHLRKVCLSLNSSASISILNLSGNDFHGLSLLHLAATLTRPGLTMNQINLSRCRLSLSTVDEFFHSVAEASQRDRSVLSLCCIDLSHNLMEGRILSSFVPTMSKLPFASIDLSYSRLSDVQRLCLAWTSRSEMMWHYIVDTGFGQEADSSVIRLLRE